MDEPERTDMKGVIVAGINSFIAVLLIPFGVDLFEQVGIIVFGKDVLIQNPYLSAILAYLPIFYLISIFLRATMEPLRKFGFFFSKKLLPHSFIVGLISAIVLYAVDVKYGILESFSVPKDPTITVMLGFFVAWGILVPLVEEALFRGMIQTKFQKLIKSTWKVHPAVFIASVFEVLLHIVVPLWFASRGHVAATFTGTIPQLFYVLVFGAIGGYIFQRTGSLTGPLLIHGMGNVGEIILFWIFF